MFKITLTEIKTPIELKIIHIFFKITLTKVSNVNVSHVQTILYLLQNNTEQKVFGFWKDKAYIVMN